MTILPDTRLGKWAAWLALAYFLVSFSWRLMGPLGAFPAFAAGIAGGIVALVAIFRRGDRALTVYAAILPLAFVVLFVAAELLIGHD